MEYEQSSNRAAHWQSVYEHKADRETSWFQDEPVPSIDLVRCCLPRGGRVVDIGGGTSALAGQLAQQGFDVTVVDISSAAIDRAKIRAGHLAERIRWVVADVTSLHDLGEFDLWHDRAAFHFLTAHDDRLRYAALAAKSVVPGGHLVLGAFGTNGPEQCSGLPVERYDEAKITAAFADGFALARSLSHTHITPWGKPQEFFYAVMQRTDSKAGSEPRR